MKTRLCELLGIEYPIIQGGMAWVATAELAAAVSNGGGIGLIAAGNAPADVVRAQIQKAKSLTDKPFGVNVMMMSPFVEEVMQVIIEEKPAVVATGAGNPGKYIASLKEAGIKIMPVVASVAMAKKMEKDGADYRIYPVLYFSGRPCFHAEYHVCKRQRRNRQLFEKPSYRIPEHQYSGKGILLCSPVCTVRRLADHGLEQHHLHCRPVFSGYPAV